MRSFNGDTRNYFKSGNANYLAFWLMDPFVYNQNSSGGELIFQFGEISEDILKDGELSIESSIGSNYTVWGYYCSNIFLPYAFNNYHDPYDVGLDGLSDVLEQS